MTSVDVVKANRLRHGKRASVFDYELAAAMVLLAIITLYPFINVLAVSFNDAYDTIKGGIYLWPRMFTLANYEQIFKDHNLIVAFRNSVLRTVIGMVVSVFCTTMMAYTLSRKDFIARRVFSLMFAVTMYVGGGMIPSYLLMRSLGLFGTFTVYILPSIVGAWNVFVIRSYIDGLPDSIQESARVDGANDVVIFIRIVLPLCLPVLATVALFVAVGQWNSWFDSYLYNNSKPNLTTLQYELQKILTAATISLTSASDQMAISEMTRRTHVTPEALKMAMSIIVTAPVLVVYPFLQKYFVSGLTMGAVKS
ncbi:sugar ABC transporter permease [Clostridia bacterium]|nr:sugar ABC transporter permease [Clostridia bacterium]